MGDHSAKCWSNICQLLVFFFLPLAFGFGYFYEVYKMHHNNYDCIVKPNATEPIDYDPMGKLAAMRKSGNSNYPKEFDATIKKYGVTANMNANFHGQFAFGFSVYCVLVFVAGFFLVFRLVLGDSKGATGDVLFYCVTIYCLASTL